MATIRSVFKMEDQATKTFKSVSSAINETNNKVSTLKEKVIKMPSNAFKNWQADVITINSTLEVTKKIVNGIVSLLKGADNLSLIKSRLDLINDGQRTTKQLQDEILKSSLRSRGSYEDMSKSVAKLGLLAKDAFKNNKEILDFTELMNKAFKISGADPQEISSAMYQLTQAMSAGKLQGDEFRSITENAPMLADAIAKYMGKSKGELKALSSEGVITSDVIKNALFKSADEINDKFSKMPQTFQDAGTRINNIWNYSMQKVADKISTILNSDKFNEIFNNISAILLVLVDIIAWSINFIGNVIDFLKNNFILLIPIIVAVGGVLLNNLVNAIVATTISLLQKAAAWALANYQMLMIMGTILIVAGVLYELKAPLEIIIGVIFLLIAVLALWHIHQWMVNTAMYACPIVWIIVLVIALIAAIYMFLEWMAKATKLANSGLGMIAGGVNVVIQFFVNLGLLVANIALGIWKAMGACAGNVVIAFRNAIRNVKAFWYGLLETITRVVLGVVELLNKIPFVNIDTKGLKKSANNFAKSKAKEEASKEKYLDVGSEFDKGLKTFNAFGNGWVEKAWKDGASWGDNLSKGIGDKIGSLDPTKKLKELTQQGNPNKLKMPKDTVPNYNVPVHVKKNSDKKIELSDEDLKMLKDIANKEYSINYKQVTPNVNIKFGDVKETADINKIKKELDKMMQEELSELYTVEES
nr:MAG TPA: Tail tape measure [Caudoviricetes sp.]